MEIVIYGKPGCVQCDKARMLCQIQSLPFQYLTVGSDVTAESLEARLGQAVRSLPQIWVHRAGAHTHVGGYEGLRQAIQAAHTRM